MKKVLFGEQKFSAKAVGFIELAHPAALNALDTGMLADIEKKLKSWERDPEIALVVFHSENAKAFCAGGDVKKLTLETQEKGIEIAENFFTQEYFTDWCVHNYSKPILAWLDGITMGGGIGLTQGASHRVVTDKTMLSMPEVFIGLFPDVGGSGFLPRLKDGFGYFTGLSGARLSGRLGYDFGWANYFLAQERKRKVFADILKMEWVDSNAQNSELLTKYLRDMMILEKSLSSQAPELSDHDQKLMGHWKAISLEFQNALLAHDFSKLVDLVQKTEGSDGRHRSILSQALFYEMARRWEGLAAADLNWQKILELEWVAAVEMSKGKSFPEGVRAVLIDKDQKPNWPDMTADEALAEARRILASPIDNHLVEKFKTV